MLFPKQKKPPYLKFLAPVFLMVAMFFLLPQPARAAWESIITGIIGPIIIWVIGFLGDLLISLIHIMITVAQYNDFINSPAVAKTWIVIRDLCNLFFVVILLVIAFGTVLGSEKYNYKKYLIPLFLMAILINFSKTISGLIIDFCQVVMMQFVNGFRYAAAGNLTTAFGLDRMLSFMRELPSDLQEKMAVESFTSLLLALCMMIIAVVTTAVILVVFLARIVALWLLVMLSPVAFLANAAPGGEKYSKMWWDKFTNYAIAGPVLAFFLWVSFSIMAMNPANVSSVTGLTVPKNPSEISGFEKEKDNIVSVGISQVGSSEQVLSFCLSIAMLLASLAATKQLGVAGSSLAMAAKGKLEAAGKRVAKVGLGIGAVTLGGGWGLGALAAYRTAKGVGGAARDEIKAGAGQGWNYLTTNKVTRWAGLSKKAREEAAKRRQTRWQAWAGLKPERAEARKTQIEAEGRERGMSAKTLEQLLKEATKSGDRGTAAILELQKKGYFAGVGADDDKAKGMVNRTIERLPQDLKTQFEQGIMKHNFGLAVNTIFHEFKNDADLDRALLEHTQGTIKLDQKTPGLSDAHFKALETRKYLQDQKNNSKAQAEIANHKQATEKLRMLREGLDSRKVQEDQEIAQEINNVRISYLKKDRRAHYTDEELIEMDPALKDRADKKKKEWQDEIDQQEQVVAVFNKNIGSSLGKYFTDALDESELTSLFKNLSKGRREGLFGGISPGDIKTKEQKEKVARATGLFSPYDLSNTDDKRAFQTFLEDNKEAFVGKINTLTFQDRNGKPLAVAIKELTKVMKNSELADKAKKDKRLQKAMAEATREVVDGYNKSDNFNKDTQSHRDLLVKLSGGEDIDIAYDIKIKGAEDLLDASLKTGGISGKDFFKAAPEKIPLEYFAKKLKGNQIRSILAENNVGLYDALMEKIKTVDLEKYNNIRRSEFTA